MTAVPARRLSLVVPSYNRAAYLHVLLTSLTWSAVPASEFEVVVVNDGGRDDLPGLVEHWRRRGLDVRLVTLRTDGPPRNNARARNAGLAVARHPIVLQTDPDIVFVDDVLAVVRDAVDTRSLCSCDGYYPLTRESAESGVFRPGATVTPELLRRAAAGRPNQVHSPDGVGGFHGAFACATETLRALGGYDESFEYWGWEDRELLVSAAARGLRRRWLPGTQVVHLWHPLLRGDLGREGLAAQGQISRAAWDVQMQRAAAEIPRASRVRPRPRADDDATVVPFTAAAFDRWRTDADEDAFALASARLAEGQLDCARAVLPGTYQMAFDALVGEADVLTSTGAHALAADAIRLALRRPWEWPHAPLADAVDGAPSPLGLYRRVDGALERLAAAEHALGRRRPFLRALGHLARVEGGAVKAAACRMRLALGRGDLRAARRNLAALDRHPRTAQQEALALECQLLDGRIATSRARLDSAVEHAWRGDYFDRLRATAYARLCGCVDALPAGDPATTDTSEFLFSAAVRAERAGLDIAAAQLYHTFLSAGGPTEPRLGVDAVARSARVRARVTAVAGTVLAATLCAPVWSDAAQAR
jgi:Glycosyl transferase family 2/N-terminal domain of galactosyltransferase